MYESWEANRFKTATTTARTCKAGKSLTDTRHTMLEQGTCAQPHMHVIPQCALHLLLYRKVQQI